jgi:tetratricopeptide (TPR) repeat protein
MHLAELTQEKRRTERRLAEAEQSLEAGAQDIKDQLEIEYKSLIDKIKPLQKEKDALEAQLEEAQKNVKASETKAFKYQQQADLLSERLAKLEEQNQDLKRENEILEKEGRALPGKFAELAGQNKRLIDDTADMHYNLGVFYTNNHEYKRAVQEFEKALKIRPSDAGASYNLGYIYAEYLVDRPKAIKFFKDYLTFAPDAKDAEWVRNYILTWQSWYGKVPIK